MRPSIRGGVPVLNRDTVSPSSSICCATATAGCSPARPAGICRVRSHVNATAQECPGGDHNRARREPSSVGELDAAHYASFRCIRRVTIPCVISRPAVLRAIVRTARRYNTRSHWARGAHTAGPLERLSMRNWIIALIGGAPHDPAESVHLADHRTLRDSADRGIATHLADRVEVATSAAGRAHLAGRPSRPLRCRRGHRRQR